MKLFTRYNRINLLSTVVIFLLASVAYGFLLRYVLIDQVDETLKTEQQEIETYVSKYNRLPEVIPVRDQHTVFTSGTGPFKRKFRTSQLYDNGERESDYYRQVIFGINAGGKWYNVTVGKSLEGTDDMIRSIIVITVGTILLILLTSLVINRMLLNRLWQPFYNTLSIMRSFQLGSKEVLYFPENNIDEFSFMNKTLWQSIRKAQQDYLLLKEFTENASHELQTPLAVIRSKMDLLIQDEHLSEPQSQAVQMAYDAIQKLSRLNQSLLLLARIENRQFEESVSINLREKIEDKLAEFQELWQDKGLRVITSLQEVSVVMNGVLADVLLNNLLSNATRHNKQGGDIRIELQNHQLIISNTGADGALDEHQLFTRFYKASPSSDNNGLGLSIVRQICEVSGFRVEYNFKKEMHEFGVVWG
jgi:signal transduction histidine kinase